MSEEREGKVDETNVPSPHPPLSPNTLSASPCQNSPLPLPDWVKGRKVRVYSDGVYDLTHAGHFRVLEQAKKLFGEENTVLIAGVCSDADTEHYKGKTVMTEAERAENVRHCRWVDEVVCPCPWTLTQSFLDTHSIDIVVHGEDAQVYDGGDVYAFVKAQGKFRFLKRTDGLSTSDIICRILRNYDRYLVRNLDRGFSREELNCGFVREKMARLDGFVARRAEGEVRRFNDRIERRLATWREAVGRRIGSLRETVTDAYKKINGDGKREREGSQSSQGSQNGEEEEEEAEERAAGGAEVPGEGEAPAKKTKTDA